MIARLETSFGALRRFTADASHELKTPLTVLRADVERAMHPGAQGAEAMQALEEALQETARMSDLVDSLLTLARADEGRFDLHREPVELEPLVRDVYETAVILGEDCGLTVSMSVARGSEWSRATHAPSAAVPQPHHERDQVHAARRSRGAVAEPSPRRRDRLHRARYGDRDVGGRSLRTSSSASGAPTARARARVGARRLRARAGDQSVDRAGARRTLTVQSRLGRGPSSR